MWSICAIAQYLRLQYRNKCDKWMSYFIVCWVLCTRLNGLSRVNLTLETQKTTSTYLIAFRNKYSWQVGSTG